MVMNTMSCDAWSVAQDWPLEFIKREEDYSQEEKIRMEIGCPITDGKNGTLKLKIWSKND